LRGRDCAFWPGGGKKGKPTRPVSVGESRKRREDSKKFAVKETGTINTLSPEGERGKKGKRGKLCKELKGGDSTKLTVR